MTPSTFGRYVLRETLGWGGFATVYRALDPVLGREVALKTLLPHLARDPRVRARFLAEARALAALRHPNIVTVYEAGDADDVPFIAMELADGPTLSALVGAAGPLPLPRVLDLLRGLCSAIDYLHAAGMVHRDLTAANVMLDAGDRVLLMDFGIARALEGTHFTRTGIPLGTPEAMAPEQVLGEVVGPPADLYALGILIYQLLAGRPPFTGDVAHVLYAQVHLEPPDIHTLRPDLPAAVQEALARALAKQPDQRPDSAGALLAALREVPIAVAHGAGDRVESPAPPREATPLDPNPDMRPHGHRWSWRRLRPMVAVAAFTLCFVAAFAIGFFALRNGKGSAQTPTLRAAGTSPRASGLALAAEASSCTARTGLDALRCEAAAASSASATAAPAATSPTAASTATLTPSSQASTTFKDGTIGDATAWATGTGQLQGCATLVASRSGIGLRLRVATPDLSTPPWDGPLMLTGGATSTEWCTTLAAQAPAAGTYQALLYDQDWHEVTRRDFTVAPPPTPGSRAIPLQPPRSIPTLPTLPTGPQVAPTQAPAAPTRRPPSSQALPFGVPAPDRAGPRLERSG